MSSRLRNGLARAALPPPVRARQFEYSLIMSPEGQTPPSQRLVDLAGDIVNRVQRIELAEVVARMSEPPYWPEVWPGEHYRLLAAIVEAQQPEVVVEIGTATGLSALSMLARLPQGARLATFDVVPWTDDATTVLREEDFADGRLVQYSDDVSEPAAAERHAELLRSADFIFVDAAKDGQQERRFLDVFGRAGFQGVLMLDDIRQWNMLRIWREIDRPKMDITSFGHWSGTGLVDFAEAPERPLDGSRQRRGP